MTIDWFPVNLY